jgi:glycosyltransferase involved in cell wall biosynthesis
MKEERLKISVLIPAFRPRFLGQAIASVLTQGVDDLEIVIGDDSGGDDLIEVVKRFADPRIRYLRTAGRVGGTENLRGLWGLAAADRIKFLFDDDLMLPNALIDLAAELDQRPEASFVFGNRDIIDEFGRIQSEPRSISANKTALLQKRDLAGGVVPRCINWIGEFSNLLMNRSCGLSLDDIYQYRGFDIEMLGDVAFYLNASAKGPAVGIGKTVGHFRRHSEQNSSQAFNPKFAKAVCEWELFVRGEYAAGMVNPEQALAGVDRVSRLYSYWAERLPELAPLSQGVPLLRERITSGDCNLLDQAFRDTWRIVDGLVAARAAREGRPLEEEAGA